MALALPGWAMAKSEIVKFEVEGKKVVGTLTLPDGIRQPPVVLMLHGFTGSRDEWSSPYVKEGLFGRTAPALAQNGIASLRIDFRGSGESEGKFDDMTVETEVTDALAAIAWLKSQRCVDGKRISVMGMSLGGAVATAAAGRTHDRLKAIVLWNPGTDLPLAFTNIFGEAGMKQGIAAGDRVHAAPTRDGKKIALRGRFFEGLYKFVPAAEIASYHGPMFLAVGTTDQIVAPQPLLAQSLLAYHHGPEELWTRPVGHDFGILAEERTLNELIESSVGFLKAHAF